MAQVGPFSGIQLQAGTPYNRVFWFGTTGQTLTINLSKNTGGFAGNNGGAGAIHEIANGWYWVALNLTDTNTPGDLAYHITAGAGGPLDFSDQVVATLLSNIALDATGHVIASGFLRQNVAVNFPFTMTASGIPKAGLTITAQRNFGSGYTTCAGAITDVGNGNYFIALTSADTNSPTAIYRFTATGADDNDVIVIFSP